MALQRASVDGAQTSRTLNDLIQQAKQMGIRVHISHLDDSVGVYDHTTQEIHLSFGLTPVEQRSVLAHELGHAYHGHDCSNSRNERQADAYAANLLINADDYARAERHSPNVHDIAAELDVTDDIVTAYQDLCLQQLGHITYGRQHRGTFTNALARALFNRQDTA